MAGSRNSLGLMAGFLLELGCSDSAYDDTVVQGLDSVTR